MWQSISKIGLVALAASYATLVAFNNVTDYGSNFEFVQHVLSMDTTFPGNKAMWRAIESPALHHLGYGLIIATEIAVAILGWIGAAALCRARFDRRKFDDSKRWATYALSLGIALWFGGFIVVGGEWFLMWQSKIWNGIEASFRISAFFAIVLVYLNADDTGSNSSN